MDCLNMKIERIFPSGRAPQKAKDLQIILKNIITLINYQPVIRTQLNWAGTFRIPQKNEAWTFKIKGFKGIFATSHNKTLTKASYVVLFDLFYFPEKDEEIAEKFSIKAELHANSTNYTEMIRKFTEHPNFASLFYIGELALQFNPHTQALSIGINAVSEDVVIAKNGIKIEENGQEKYLLYPGEKEQSIPSFYLSSAVLNIIASSMCFLVDAKPFAINMKKIATTVTEISDGKIKKVKSKESLHRIFLNIVFGKDNNETFFLSPTKKSEIIEEKTWTIKDEIIPEGFFFFTFFKTPPVQNISPIDKNLLGINSKPPMFIVTGFLGAGKTTFIKQVLEFQRQKYHFGVVIQNEIGEVGLDENIIDSECKVISMDEGCVCCSLAGNLRKGIKKILNEFIPDFVILETTGVANPLNILAEIDALCDIVAFDSVITIVDALNFEKSTTEFVIARDQIAAADIIIINKIDCIEDEELKKIKASIQKINDKAIIETSEFGHVNNGLFFIDDKLHQNKKKLITLRAKSHVHEKIASLTIKDMPSIELNDFIKKFNNVPTGILRMKGLLQFKGEDNPMLVQYVSGKYEISKWDTDFNETFLVIIGKEEDLSEAKRILLS